MSIKTATRKEEHLELCKSREVRSLSDAGWDAVRLAHCALPEFDFSEVCVSTSFLGRVFKYPILISSMTGGSPQGDFVNRRLAEFAARQNIPMGVGSQRVHLENREQKLFDVRTVAPRATLYANIGLVQFNYGVSVDDCLWLVENLEADALILHANVLQECIQAEGTRNFSQLLRHITALKQRLKVPVILKETGCGLDPQSCVRAREAGVDAVDIAGLGGTHWGYIEGLRRQERQEVGTLFRDWGLPTATLLPRVRAALGPDFPVLASGGVQNGLHIAKALALGAQFVGMALPFLQAAMESESALERFFATQVEALKIALFCCGAKNAEELHARQKHETTC